MHRAFLFLIILLPHSFIFSAVQIWQSRSTELPFKVHVPAEYSRNDFSGNNYGKMVLSTRDFKIIAETRAYDFSRDDETVINDEIAGVTAHSQALLFEKKQSMRVPEGLKMFYYRHKNNHVWYSRITGFYTAFGGRFVIKISCLANSSDMPRYETECLNAIYSARPLTYSDEIRPEFNEIAGKTGGSFTESPSPDKLPETVSRVTEKLFDKKNSLDLVIAIDTTGSMHDDIAFVKEKIKQVLHDLKKNVKTMRVGLVFYKDKYDSQPIAILPFTRDIDTIEQAIASADISGGFPDWAEAIIDALWHAVTDFNWESKNRAVILIGDAPAQKTSFEDENRTMQTVIEKATASGINIKIFTIYSGVGL